MYLDNFFFYDSNRTVYGKIAMTSAPTRETTLDFEYALSEVSLVARLPSTAGGVHPSSFSFALPAPSLSARVFHGFSSRRPGRGRSHSQGCNTCNRPDKLFVCPNFRFRIFGSWLYTISCLIYSFNLYTYPLI